MPYKCCRLSHFDYVKSEDLERIGMGKPAIRRLVDVVKKRNRKKNLLDKVVFKQSINQSVIYLLSKHIKEIMAKKFT